MAGCTRSQRVSCPQLCSPLLQLSQVALQPLQPSCHAGHYPLPRRSILLQLVHPLPKLLSSRPRLVAFTRCTPRALRLAVQLLLRGEKVGVGAGQGSQRQQVRGWQEVCRGLAS